MSDLINEIRDARAAALMVAITKWDREYLDSYGTKSVFTDAMFQIEPGAILRMKLTGVEARLSFKPNSAMFCSLEIPNGNGGLIRSHVEFHDLDQLADWLELQGDPVE